MDSTKRLVGVLCVMAAGALAGCERSPGPGEPNRMVLRHVLYGRIASLDPAGINDIYSRVIASQIFETACEYHFLKRPYELVPLLAERMPALTADGLVYTIKIRPGVFFADDACFAGGRGRELTAGDFVYALKRIANVKTLSPNWAPLEGRIVGLDDFREYTIDCADERDVDYSRPVEGLASPDDHTLVVRLTGPWPQFPNSVLAQTAYAPVAREAVDYYGRDIRSHPVGTGPFRLARWRRGSFIELVRSPTFRGQPYPGQGEPGDAEAGYLDDAGRMMPFAERVLWTIVEEHQPAWLLFLQGQVDAAVVPRDSFDEVIVAGRLAPALQRRNIRLQTFRTPSTYWVAFNMADPVLGKNKPLRRAINRAIDRRRFVEVFFNNRHEIAHGLIPPIMPSYDPTISGKGYARFDLQAAKELLAEAVRVHGGPLPKLTLAMPGASSWFRQYGQFLWASLDALGLQLDIRYMDRPTFEQKLGAGTVQMFASGAAASMPDAIELLSLFYGKSDAPGANPFNYRNDEFDRLYEQARTMSDCPRRRELYRRMELVVLSDCPAVFLNHRVAYVLYHDWYNNYKPHAFAFGLSKYRRIDPARRAAYRQSLKNIE